jgi:hypothetical protein
MEIKKLRKNMEVKALSNIDMLKKLQLSVSLIFVLMTLGIILAIVDQWAIGVGLALLGYIITFILMIKLLSTKKL